MIYGDIKTRSQRVRAGLFRGGRRGRIAGFILRGLGAFALLDFAGFIAWILSGQVPPESGYYLGKLTVELLKVVIQ